MALYEGDCIGSVHNAIAKYYDYYKQKLPRFRNHTQDEKFFFFFELHQKVIRENCFS